MFPIFDMSERMIAFGGRILPSDDEREGAKYINSPDTPVYTKGDELYGLAQAKKALRSAGYAILVEGNVDVIMLHQAGLENTVAPMGTALTEKQVRLLKRFVPEVVLLFDGDDAGLNAARKSLPLLIEADLHGRVVLLPTGEDPDSYVVEHGGPALRTLVEKAPPLVEFLIDDAVSRHGRSDRGRAQTLAELAPVVHGIRDFRERDLVVARIGSVLGLPEARVAGMLRGRPSHDARRTEVANVGAHVVVESELPLRERKLVEVCLHHPEILDWVEEVDAQAYMEDVGLRGVLWEALTLQGEVGRVEPTVLLERLGDQPITGWVSSVLCGEPVEVSGGVQAYVKSCVQFLADDWAQRNVDELVRRIERAERDGDHRLALELAAERTELARKRKQEGLEGVLNAGGGPTWSE
jgi:DNA primase